MRLKRKAQAMVAGGEAAPVRAKRSEAANSAVSAPTARTCAQNKKLPQHPFGCWGSFFCEAARPNIYLLSTNSFRELSEKLADIFPFWAEVLALMCLKDAVLFG